MSKHLRLIQGGKPEAMCTCDEPDVYDGYAECSVHPAAEEEKS